MHQVSFIVSAFSLLALAVLISGRKSQVSRVYELVHGLIFCVRGVLIVLLYPAYDCVAFFGLSNGFDGEMNTIITRLHPTRGSPNNVYASSLIPGQIVLQALICALSSVYRPERGLR